MPFSAFSKHIIGGEITYEYIETLPSGEKVWSFVLHVYRDCDAGAQAATLDVEAPIAIYREISGSLVLIDTLMVREKFNGKGQRIPPDLSSPCLDVPPSVCVEEGVYAFKMTLPVLTDGSYHIVYQRCCRNVTIANLVNPDDFGATYAVELTALAQSLNNSSPVWKQFPKIVICMDFPVFFDHSATDANGDQLTYSFFTPLAGGGPDTSPSGSTTCTGSAPTPPCPPPFAEVAFLSPYTEQNPMGGSPQITINPTTGLLDGKPDLQGQFVVGIEVIERRNGQILSVIRREFQFNVTPCTPQVLADIKEDSISLGGVFKVISCGSATVKVVNESTVLSNIDNWYWIFNYKNGQRDSLPGVSSKPDVNWSPLVTFPDTGDYKGILVLNPKTPCEDSAEVIFKIRPDIRADFSFQQDSCASGRILFEDNSVSQAAPIQYWFWEFGDGSDTSALLKNPIHIYEGPSGSTAQLVAVDTAGCRDTVRLDVPFTEFPKLAAFDFTPKDLNTLQKTVDFVDQSTDAVKWRWQFGAVGTSSQQNPMFAFPDTGQYRVNLFITDDRGCTDSTSRFLDIKPLVIWHMPNAFTPNGDGSNDEFFGRGYIAGSTDFSMTIWNRYGEKIFESRDPERGWNGRKNGEGEVLPNGVYVYLLTFKGPRGEPFEQKGYATIVR